MFRPCVYYVLYTLFLTQSSCSPIHCEASWYLQHGKLFACLLCGWQMQCHTDTTSSTSCKGQLQLITLNFWEGFEHKELIIIICSYTLYMALSLRPLHLKIGYASTTECYVMLYAKMPIGMTMNFYRSLLLTDVKTIDSSLYPCWTALLSCTGWAVWHQCCAVNASYDVRLNKLNVLFWLGCAVWLWW